MSLIEVINFLFDLQTDAAFAYAEESRLRDLCFDSDQVLFHSHDYAANTAFEHYVSLNYVIGILRALSTDSVLEGGK